MVIKSHKKYKNKINSKGSTRRNKKSMSNKVKKQRKTQKLINKKRKTYKKVGGANPTTPNPPAPNQPASNPPASNQPESKSRFVFPGQGLYNRRKEEIADNKRKKQLGREKDAEYLNTIKNDDFIDRLHKKMCFTSMEFAKSGDIAHMPKEIEYTVKESHDLSNHLTKIRNKNKNKNNLNELIYQGIKNHILKYSPLVKLPNNKKELMKKMKNKKYETCSNDVEPNEPRPPRPSSPPPENSITEEKDMGKFRVIRITNSTTGNESYKVVENSSN